MTYGIALEKQAQVLKFLQSSSLREGALPDYFGFDETQHPSNSLQTAANLKKHLIRCCEGDAMFVERDISRALVEEADNVPREWMLTADLLVTDPGFCIFEEPPMTAALQNGDEVPLIGFAWTSLADSVGDFGLSIMSLTQNEKGQPYVLSWFGWPLGKTLGQRKDKLTRMGNQGLEEFYNSAEVLADKADAIEKELQSIKKDFSNASADDIIEAMHRLDFTKEQHEQFRKDLFEIQQKLDWFIELDLFALLVEFTHQSIVIRERRKADRATRRRLNKKPEDISEVVVVTLRRKSPKRDHDDGDGSKREFSHRWVVQSHWRNQWYASMGVHRPRLIAAYVKGPEDKPLITKRRVFRVAR